MRSLAAHALLICLVSAANAQSPPPDPKFVTVPLTLDQNRIVVDVDLALPGGSTQRVRAWVDNGNPELFVSRRVATWMNLAVTCAEKFCSAPAPPAVVIGGMKISFAAATQAGIPLMPPPLAQVMAPGMNAEINIPSTVLRNYDVLVNLPGHELTIAQPGTLKFLGEKTKAIVNAETGLIQIPSHIENKKYNFGLDLGSSISFLPEDLFNKLSGAHPAWPHMAGAIGPANLWGTVRERNQKLMRVDRIQFGALFLTSVAVAESSEAEAALSAKRSIQPGSGLLGVEALQNYRIGFDYVHSSVYFEIGRTFNSPDFDVVGLILQPEDDGRFTILGAADYEGKPSVPQGPAGVQPGDHLIAVDDIPVQGSTMGQVWSMLGGIAGKERRLGIERAGKQFTVNATLRHFLGDSQDR